VIDELDSFKTRTGELAANAREVIRDLDQLRRFGRLVDGVPIPATGKILKSNLAEGKKNLELMIVNKKSGGICKIFTEDAMKQLSDSSDKEWPPNPTTSDKVIVVLSHLFS
jgi:predicted ribonuclease YlaK